MSTPTQRNEGEYHYTESGLDNVYLVSGFKLVPGPRGTQLQIDDIDGLHRAIGEILVSDRKNLSGKEIRFLRIEMGMSQSALARLLGISERAVIRWEKAHIGQVPSTAEASIRMLYRDFANERHKPGTLRQMLKKVADRENDEQRVSFRKPDRAKWRVVEGAEETQLELAAI